MPAAISLRDDAHQGTLYDALLALPENLVGEVIAGRLYAQPRPTGPHALAERGLNIELDGLFDEGRGGPGGWWILSEPEVHFVRDTEVVVSDLAGWSRQRTPEVLQDHRVEVVPGGGLRNPVACHGAKGQGVEIAALPAPQRVARLAGRSARPHAGSVRAEVKPLATAGCREG